MRITGKTPPGKREPEMAPVADLVTALADMIGIEQPTSTFRKDAARWIKEAREEGPDAIVTDLGVATGRIDHPVTLDELEAAAAALPHSEVTD
jgi:hypothetical protein